MAGAPSSPGVYLFHDRNDAVSTWARPGRTRAPLVLLGRPPASLRRGGARGARADRWRPSARSSRRRSRSGSSASWPPANARGRSDRSAYLELRARTLGRRDRAGAVRPVRSKRRLQLAARALEGFEGDEPKTLPALRKAPPARPRPALRGRRSRPRPARGPRGGGRSHRDARAAPEDRALRPRARAGAWPAPRLLRRRGRVAAARTLAPGACREARGGGGPRRGGPRGPRTRPRTPTTCSSSRASCGAWPGAAHRRARRCGDPRGVTVASRPPGRHLALAQMDAVPFADRLVEAVERKRSQLVVGLDPASTCCRWSCVARPCWAVPPRRRPSLASAGGISEAVAVRRRRQAADRVLRGARLGRSARARGGATTRGRPGCSCSSTRSEGDIGFTARAYAHAYLEPRDGGAPLADAMTASPYLGETRSSRCSPPAGGTGRCLLPRPDLERGRGRRSGPRPLGRTAAVAVPRRARARVGAPLVGDGVCRASGPSWGRRTRAGLRGTAPAAAVADPAPRCRCAGRDAPPSHARSRAPAARS